MHLRRETSDLCVHWEKILRVSPLGQCGDQRVFSILLTCLLLITASGTAAPKSRTASDLFGSDVPGQWEDLPVHHVSLEGVAADRLAYLQGHLVQAEGAPLKRENVASSLRQLFATGLFDSIEVVARREGDGVALIFRGTPRTFIGNVEVDGAKGATMDTQLERASSPGAGRGHSIGD